MWFIENHMDNILQEIMVIPEEELLMVILTVPSTSPTRIAEALIAIPSIHAKIWGTLTKDDIFIYIVESHKKQCHWENDAVFEYIFNRQVLCPLGKLFQKTDFWKAHVDKVKKNTRDLRKIKKIMSV